MSRLLLRRRRRFDRSNLRRCTRSIRRRFSPFRHPCRFVRRKQHPGMTAFSFASFQQGIQSGVRPRIEVTENKSLGNFRPGFVFQSQLHRRIRARQGDIAGQVRQRLDVGVTDQRFPLFFLAGRHAVTYRVCTVRVLLAGLEDFFLTDFAGGKLSNLFTWGAEKGTGVHHVEQRRRGLHPVNIFKLGIRLDTKHITAAELTRFRQDLDQVRQLVQRGELIRKNPHAPVTVLPHPQQAADSDRQPH
ncbi:Uncharacterised protein [Klebsiella aerogenes]|nr:Uncharacterised protein [Klebsiella aerogenes]